MSIVTKPTPFWLVVSSSQACPSFSSLSVSSLLGVSRSPSLLLRRVRSKLYSSICILPPVTQNFDIFHIFRGRKNQIEGNWPRSFVNLCRVLRLRVSLYTPENYSLQGELEKSQAAPQAWHLHPTVRLDFFPSWFAKSSFRGCKAGHVVSKPYRKNQVFNKSI